MIAIFQHEPEEGPGRLADALAARGLPFTILHPGEPTPDLHSLTGVISLGGEMDVADGLPWMAGEQALLAAAHHSGIPVLGICLGSQLLATALGGRVARMSEAETGWLPVHALCADPLLEALPSPLLPFHAHGCAVVALPPGAVPLLASEACPIQGFRVGPSTLGLQFHAEWGAGLIAPILGLPPEAVEAMPAYRAYDRHGRAIMEQAVAALW